MATGRCSGCGRIGSLRKINQHVIDCSQYIELFVSAPLRCLAPAEEYQRYQAQEHSAVAKAEHRGARLAARFAEINRHQAAATVRWQRPPDILE